MIKWLATIQKESRLLLRDRTGLMLLFVMPTALVLVITLVQDNVLRQTGGLRMNGVVVDHDGAQAARLLMRELDVAPSAAFLTAIDGQIADEVHAGRWVEAKKIQFYVVIPAGLSQAVASRTRRQMEQLASGAPYEPSAQAELPQISVFFDPATHPVYRVAVNGAVQQAIGAMQVSYSMQMFSDALEHQLRRRMAEIAGPALPQTSERLVPAFNSDKRMEPVALVQAQSANQASDFHLPTAVQQNVPAWALFGMFFIVVPLSGAMIRERREGITARLTVMPVSQAVLFLGKLMTYVAVCLVQFICIVLVGKWLLPLLGTDALEVKNHLGAMTTVALCAALAAAGYGILLGTLARTNEQAGILGPVSVVIAAALGGIMVPVFAMPPVMQTISRISPLAWAHEAFMTILVRDGRLSAIWYQLSLLMLFFAFCLGLALILFHRQRSRV